MMVSTLPEEVVVSERDDAGGITSRIVIPAPCPVTFSRHPGKPRSFLYAAVISSHALGSPVAWAAMDGEPGGLDVPAPSTDTTAPTASQMLKPQEARILQFIDLGTASLNMPSPYFR